MDDLDRLLRNVRPLFLDDDSEEFESYRSVNPVCHRDYDGFSGGRGYLHDPEFQIEISSLHFPTRVHDIIFNSLHGEDIKNCRLVCRDWNHKSSPYLDEKTLLVFNGEDSPWAFFTPAITQNLMSYLRDSSTKFSFWTSMKIHCGSTSQLEPLLSSNFSDTFRRAVQRIKSLHLQTCFIDWDTLCRLLNHFSGLESLFDDQNVYFERVSFLTQVITTITVPISPTISSTAIAEVDFVNKFREYNATLQLSKLVIRDSGIGTHTSAFVQLLCKSMVDGYLENLTIIAGGADTPGSSAAANQTKVLQFWLIAGELIVFAKSSLRKLTISCTHEKSLVNSFDLFVMHCIETVNAAEVAMPLEYLSLDFKFLWLSHPTIQTELIPFVRSLRRLKSFYIKTVIMKPSWVHRLEMLKPKAPKCFFDIGVHVTDIEGESNLAPIIQLMHSDLYQIFMSTIHVSVITQDVLELGQMISTEVDTEYTNVKKFSLTVMSVAFLDFSVDIIVKNYPNLTVLELIDGPLIHQNSTDGAKASANNRKHRAIKEHHGVSQYGNMSHALFDDDAMQAVLKTLRKLKVLSLQCNMNGLSDVGMTGLSASTCALLRRTGHAGAVVDLEYDLVGHSLVNLKDLRKLTLRGLGKLLTDVSVYYGFLKLTKLSQLVLYGTLELSSTAKNQLCRRLGDKRCQIQIHMPY